VRRGFVFAFALATFVAGCFSLDGFSGGIPTSDAGAESRAAAPSDGGDEARALDAAVSDAGADSAPSGPACGGRGVGAPMVQVMDAGFCIDTTEVTYSQYADFYKAAPQPDGVCTFKTGYTPPAFFSGNAAIGNVDWCDAYEYCKWAGKRLCGGMNGVQLDLQNSLTPLSEWQYACTHGGSSDWPYPYGPSVDPTICLYEDSANSGKSRDVASNAKCQGPNGIFDLSGNVWEWEDACDRAKGVTNAAADCNLRGGGFLRASADWGSCADVPGGWARDSRVDDTGIRCCSDYK
jgi:sulfatase modifying factor 1